MSNIVGITDLLHAIGADNITFQVLENSMDGATVKKKGPTSITFLTDAVTPTDVVNGTGPRGLVLWVDRELMSEKLSKLKSGEELLCSYQLVELKRQCDELKAVIKELELLARQAGNVAYNLGQSHKQWPSISETLNELDAVRMKALGLCSK